MHESPNRPVSTEPARLTRPGSAGPIGAIKTIFRYPIKSVGGRDVSRAYVGPQGVLGDRRYAFLDLKAGQLCNAKNPRKYARLLACRAHFVNEPVPDAPLPTLEVVFPDGSSRRNVGTDLDDAMSRYLGVPVQLISSMPAGVTSEIVWDQSTGLPKDGTYARTVRNADGDDVLTFTPAEGDTFFDLTTLHFITTSTLRHFQKLEPTANFDARRYRPTMVIDTPAPGLVEDDWTGGRLRLGDRLDARVDLCTPRCVMSTLAHHREVPLDRSTLRTIVKHNTKVMPDWGSMACAGVYGEVLTPGAVRIGDPVRFSPNTAPAGAPAALLRMRKANRRPRK